MTLGKRLKRYLYLTHRWLGVCMCLLFALWFISGVVIMYVQYPTLTETQRIKNLPPLQPEQIQLSAADARQRIALAGGSAQSVRLSQLMGRPAYQLRGADNVPVTVFADTGEVLSGLTPEQSLQVLRHSGFHDADSEPHYLGLVDMDQWTISGSLHPSRPLHKVSVGDRAGTVIYVSDVSGQIVLDTNRQERFWNWLGTTIHWIYPVQLRQHPSLWAEVVIWLSVAGMVSVITGGLIGFMRLRVRKPYRGKDVTPYQGVDKWHHVLGLASLIFLGTFMFSGLLSMSPWGLFSSGTSPGPQIQRYQGDSLGNLSAFPQPGSQALAGIREVDWHRVGGQPYLVLSSSADQRYVLLPGRAREPAPAQPLHDLMQQSLNRFMPDASIVGTTQLDRFDNYYYSTHNRYRPLPALRVDFDDPENTSFYLDLNSGQVVLRHTDTSRLYRWLYNGLHSLDFIVLLDRRPLWDIVVLLLSVIGLVFSLTAVMIGWRRLLQQL